MKRDVAARKSVHQRTKMRIVAMDIVAEASANSVQNLAEKASTLYKQMQSLNP